ncbi:MAG: multicopper oxidase domain-containing protein [Chloroflexota bacterium]
MDRDSHRTQLNRWARGLGVAGLLAAAALSFACTDPRGGGAKTVAANAPQEVKLAVELGDIYVKPNAPVKVAQGGTVEITATNAGALQHNLVLGDKGTKLLNKGEHETYKFGPIADNTQIFCNVPGHKDAGMVLNVEVVKAAAAPKTQAAPGAPATASGNAKVDAAATPPAGWKPRDPVLPPAPNTPAGTVRKITLEANETVLNVAPGVTQDLWTFGGQVPGPVLRGKLGDVFEITLVNKGKVAHSIDFHASKVAWNEEMRSINPGESLVYRFEAKQSGIFMYHCGTAPALHHIGNGMWGVVVIDPPNLPAVAKEYVLVQGEFYFGPEGKPGDLTKMVNEQHDMVAFNGYFNQYAFAPIRIETNERVRVWVLDAGPSENSSFHIVGTIFDTVYKEGAYTLQPSAARGGAQALDLQPAQGGFVEFTMDKVGLYPIVTHKFANVGKGALGLFQAGDMKPATGGGPAH